MEKNNNENRRSRPAPVACGVFLTRDTVNARFELYAHRVDGPTLQSAVQKVGQDRVGRRRRRGRHGGHVRLEHRRAGGEPVRHARVAARRGRVRQQRVQLPDGPAGQQRRLVRVD